MCLKSCYCSFIVMNLIRIGINTITCAHFQLWKLNFYWKCSYDQDWLVLNLGRIDKVIQKLWFFHNFRFNFFITRKRLVELKFSTLRWMSQSVTGVPISGNSFHISYLTQNSNYMLYQQIVEIGNNLLNLKFKKHQLWS